jgi:L-iditol 2-dehydrogenase
MTQSMCAAQLYGPGDMRVEQVQRPQIEADDEVLIRIRACGICPSDLRAYTGVRAGHRPFPYVPGHEWAGEIVEVGPAVEAFAVGDRVVPSWRVVCGTCYYCTRGMHNYCENLQYGRVRGGFAQYGVAPAVSLLKIPEGVSYQQASFCEPLACCINGSLASRIRLGDDVLIVGAGPIGLQHLQLAKHQGARALVSEFIPERLAMAQELGADELICASDTDPVERVKELTEGRGPNVVIVAVGARQAAEQALEMAGIGAAVNFFAGTYPAVHIPFDPNLVHYKQLVLTGSHDFTPAHFRTALRFIDIGTVRVLPLVSNVLPLSETQQGFDIVAGRKGLKVMVTMEQA